MLFIRIKRGIMRKKTLIVTVFVFAIIFSLALIVAQKVTFRHEPIHADKQARIMLAEISAALSRYMADCGQYPKEDSGLSALVANKDQCAKWLSPYLRRIPRDPWRNAYFYKVEGNHIIIGTNGADGKPGGSGEDTDIILQVDLD